MDTPLLHIEEKPGKIMHFQLKGNPVILCKLIAQAMEQNQEIAAAMIAAVMAWADKNDIPRDQLGSMVIFHKPG